MRLFANMDDDIRTLSFWMEKIYGLEQIETLLVQERH